MHIGRTFAILVLTLGFNVTATADMYRCDGNVITDRPLDGQNCVRMGGRSRDSAPDSSAATSAPIPAPGARPRHLTRSRLRRLTGQRNSPGTQAKRTSLHNSVGTQVSRHRPAA